MISLDNSGVLNYPQRAANLLTASIAFVLDTIGYGTSVPAVSFTGGGGSGATATAVLTNGKVTAINVTAAGTGYTTAPTVVIGGVGGARATATIGGGGVTAVTVNFGGTKNCITVTDNTTYPAGDSRKIVAVEIYDRYKTKVAGNVPATASPDINYVNVDISTLNPERGYAMSIKAVSLLGLVKDGSAFNISNTFNSGNVNMEK